MRWVFGSGVAEPLGPFLMSAVVGGGGGYRPYFENYTVDASIFEPTSVGSYR